MTTEFRFSLILGTANGVLGIVAVDAVYSALSTPGIWLVPIWLAAPYGTFTAWRATVYVRRLLNGSANHVRPPIEGFLLMAASTMVYAVYMAVRAGFDAAAFGTAMLLYALYAVPVGCFGASVALALMLFDILYVRTTRASAMESGKSV